MKKQEKHASDAKIKIFSYEQFRYEKQTQDKKFILIELPGFVIEQLKEYQDKADATDNGIFPVIFSGKPREDGRMYRYLDEHMDEFKEAIYTDLIHGEYELWIIGNNRIISLVRQLFTKMQIPEEYICIYQRKEIDVTHICKLRLVESDKHQTMLPVLFALEEEDFVCKN